MSASRLNTKQRVFVAEYLTDFNATAAYRRAGYTARGNSAEVNASRLLRNAKVAATIDEAIEERLKALGVTSYRVLEELSRLGFSDLRDYVEWGPDGVRLKESADLTDEAAAAVAQVSQTPSQYGDSLKFKLHDKKGSLELLGKHLKLFTDKQEHSGLEGGQITFTFDMAGASGAAQPSEADDVAGGRRRSMYLP